MTLMDQKLSTHLNHLIYLTVLTCDSLTGLLCLYESMEVRYFSQDSDYVLGQNQANTATFHGSTSQSRTSALFTRLGDT